MMTYTFDALNDKEFEALVVDLLSAETGNRLERFKRGKDGGVDGRWFVAPNSEVVVQCKHWRASGIDRLVAHLANSERAKVGRLGCARYMLATSLSLSRVDKQRIAAAMTPYLVSESDVIGAEDLNDLLGRRPAVERRHYKLWLSSMNTLTLLLNNAIIGRSRAELEQISLDAPLFVETTDYAAAARHLQERRVVILTGEPGIGKTTLAGQLVLEHAAKGFELVVLEESVSEAENVYSPESKQLFYFDDFLGRTFLDSLRAKQDSHVLRFIARVSRDPMKRFVLTSRTNILNQGATLSDLYADGHVVRNSYELRVKSLSPLDRARILYNHIWHCKLSAPFIDELYSEKRYRQIVKHKNFNPRLVAFVVDAAKLADVSPAKYWPYVLSTFGNPSGVWSHFFSGQLSPDDRDLAFLVVLAGNRIREDDLRAAFFAIPCAEPANEGLKDSRFRKAIQHTSNSVLNRSIVAGTSVIYELYNPSIADFVEAQLSKSRLWAHYYRSLRTVTALSRLEQLRSQPFLGFAEYRHVLRELHKAEAERGHPRDRYNLRLARLLAREDRSKPDAVDGLRRWLNTDLHIGDESESADYLDLMNSADGILGEEVLSARAEDMARYFEYHYIPIDQPELIGGILVLLTRFGLADVRSEFRNEVLRNWTDDIREHITSNNVLGDYVDPKQEEEAAAELRDFVERQLADFGIDASEDELSTICDRVDLDRVMTDNIRLAMQQDDAGEGRRSAPVTGSNDDAAIDDLFERWDGYRTPHDRGRHRQGLGG